MAGTKGRKKGILVKFEYHCKREGCKNIFFDWLSNKRSYCSQECKNIVQAEKYKKEDNPSWKGGLTGTRLYERWSAMKARCLNPNNKKYYLYGGRGIAVCKKWMEFEGFREDMEEGFREDLTLDRIDSNGNYCKENCRWATKKEQANNIRTNRFITYNGIRKTVGEWAEYFGFTRNIFYARYFVLKWSFEKCLTKPLQKGRVTS